MRDNQLTCGARVERQVVMENVLGDSILVSLM